MTSVTDSQLILRAAKALNISKRSPSSQHVGEGSQPTVGGWNPLINEGDCNSIIVALLVRHRYVRDSAGALFVEAYMENSMLRCREYINDTTKIDEAKRRAITRFAASDASS